MIVGGVAAAVVIIGVSVAVDTMCETYSSDPDCSDKAEF
jgi:hypothetical protein